MERARRKDRKTANTFGEILSLPPGEQEALGVRFTANEIAKQPELWLRVLEQLRARKASIQEFARSGDSPESLETWRIVRDMVPTARQLVITCNREGRLAALSREEPGSFLVVLPDDANDRGLAMTGSFTSMALAALSLGYLESWDELETLVARTSAMAARIITHHGDTLSALARTSFRRACYLGSGALAAVMREARLKMVELTAGGVAAIDESFLGIRHGPRVFINEDGIVVASLSSQSIVRRYELDLLRELRAKRQGSGMLLICDRADEEILALGATCLEAATDPPSLPDHWRILTDIVACQILATCKSIQLGLSPDQPSKDGIINRVVAGVMIHGRPGDSAGIPSPSRDG